jgi:hypothetical protein
LRGRKAVRADRRLRTDEKTIRAQATISHKNNPKSGLVLTITGFSVRMFFYPYRKPGWRTQRATSLVVMRQYLGRRI